MSHSDSGVKGDPWKQWLLYRRNPTDELAAKNSEGLKPIRDEVLDNAAIQEGETLLDVGTGTGLIAFGALERVGESGTVIFSDISDDCLDYCRSFAEETGINDRCRFVHAPIEDLSGIDDGSVDVVTSRSVLIYSARKQHAFNEFFRVLKPDGRLSIFEPINRFGYAEGRTPNMFRGFDITPVASIVSKVREAVDRHQPVEGSTLLDFDERDLMQMAFDAGFTEVHLEYKAHVAPGRFGSWDYFYRSAPNPLALSLQEAVEQALDDDEQHTFISYMQPKVENEMMIHRSALAFLVAVKRVTTYDSDDVVLRT